MSWETINYNKTLTIRDFAQSFGTTIKDIPEECIDLILKTDFRYRIIEGEEKDRLIIKILKKIESDTQINSSQERTEAWEKGWKENLEEFSKRKDLKEIVPKFVRPNQPVRLNGQYVMPINSAFERDYFNVFLIWLFKTYFKDYNPIYDFGAGSGYNLVKLARMFPEKELYGLDFVSSSQELINKIGEVFGWKMKGYSFDIRCPNPAFRLKPDGAVFTAGVIEQVKDFEAFLQYLLKESPAICVHIEPFIELHDENNIADYLAIKLHKKRGYAEGFLPRLQELEKDNKIKIINVKRLFFGSLYIVGFNFVVWKPISKK